MILKIEDINAYSKDIAVIEKHCFKTPWTDEQIRSSDNTVFFLAKEENKPIGYAGMYTVLDEGYVTNIGVMPLHRRKGVGKKLLEALIEFSNDSNLAFLSLEVRPSNLPAIKLYESFGFVSEGLRKNFYSNPREDGLIMTRYFK
ncbi:MAG: ribosomal protein S18-alanine N-acetyltransferase [Clostridia bacterium]|nr:ribosomal protein S18-alanine N-acetyltransferase [Clostridia bacterium]